MQDDIAPLAHLDTAKTGRSILGQPSELAGISPWAARMRQEIQIVGSRAVTTLISGPSGTGKELVARAIHRSSARRDQPFVPVDCAAVAGALFGSQMFGHEKGAFTGASCSSVGAFRAAHGGTLFLDELGELELDAQARLLRVLQERVVVPVGELREIPVDVRVVAATNRDLLSEVAAGRFREDLYYRLNVVSLQTTALATRREDILPLIETLLARLAVRHGLPSKPISAPAMERLLAHDWPGNVRELNNVLERAMLYCDEDQIAPHHLAGVSDGQRQPTEQTESPLHVAKSTAAWPTMAEMERQHLQATLEATEFNQTAAARLLALDRHALRRRLRRLGIEIPAAGKRS